LSRCDGGYAAVRLLTNLLQPAQNAGGTYPNLFDACPPFQIDGNYGTAAGIVEMLMRSRKGEGSAAPPAGEIELLPALPDAWSEGSVRGLRARGGFEVEVRWQKGMLVGAWNERRAWLAGSGVSRQAENPLVSFELSAKWSKLAPILPR
jgi:alpha-L-fucosidase 2